MRMSSVSCFQRDFLCAWRDREKNGSSGRAGIENVPKIDILTG